MRLVMLGRLADPEGGAAVAGDGEGGVAAAG